ncbi:MAG: hypothetical protein AAF600_01165 [Bacteroidota bacterium]
MKKLIIISLICLFVSCNDIENCGTNDEQDFMVLKFFDLESKTSKSVGFVISSEDTIYSNTVYKSDSTEAELPLNPNTDQTLFLFTSDTSSFELIMSHEFQISIFDDDCDPSIFFSNLDTIRYTFDSLSIPGRITNRQIATNVEVYF